MFCGRTAAPRLFQDIAGELVVIAAAAIEAGARIIDSDVEADDVAIEAVGPGRRADL
jgi:flagella basal body P-ring formation protein FlgA